MAAIRKEVFHKHASVNTIMHCMYGYYFLGLRKTQLARIYGKRPSTITNWIERYERDGIYNRKEREKVFLKFPEEQRKWVIELYKTNPVLYIDEARDMFQRHFLRTISKQSIHKILHAEGFTWKMIERRAMQIRETDIIHFFFELASMKWDLHQLVFLDEVSFDSRDMLRNRGYAPVGERILYRGEFRRRPRTSLLCFLGQNGLIDSFITDGTFTRKSFFECCRALARSNRIQKHPGVYSLWILDGARIHCHRSIVEFLRSVGIIVVFLPAYSPFYNPIEYMFGYVKRYLKRNYVENSSRSLSIVISEALEHFKHFDFTSVFRYFPGGIFDASVGLNHDIKQFDFGKKR